VRRDDYQPSPGPQETDNTEALPRGVSTQYFRCLSSSRTWGWRVGRGSFIFPIRLLDPARTTQRPLFGPRLRAPFASEARCVFRVGTRQPSLSATMRDSSANVTRRAGAAQRRVAMTRSRHPPSSRSSRTDRMAGTSTPVGGHSTAKARTPTHLPERRTRSSRPVFSKPSKREISAIILR
jgi:hypothetical protein